MRRSTLLPVLALLLGACTTTAAPSATPAASPSPTAIPPSTSAPSETPTGSRTAAARLVFRVAPIGGFIAPGAQLALLPDISIYDDGTIVVPGTANMADPGPSVPDLETYRLSAGGLIAFLTAARATGLGDPNASFDGLPVPDAGGTEITVDVGGTARHVPIVGLGESQDRGLDPKVVAARVKLRALLAGLTDLRTRFGADLVAGPAPYRATAMRLIVSSGDSGAASQPSLAWPLATGLAAFGEQAATAAGARCGVVAGDDLATLMPLLGRATTMSTWTSGGQPWTIVVRPLLPDESGCL